MTHIKTALNIILTVLLTNFVMFASIDKTEKKTFEVNYGGQLKVETDRGSIKIKTHSIETIEVVVKFRAKTNDEELANKLFKGFKLSYDQSGSDLNIEANQTNKKSWFSNLFGKSNWNKLNIKFIITVPNDYNVNLNTSGGGISVEDLQGLVKANTSGGGLTFGNIEGNILGKTSGGGISVGECSGSIDIKTSGGGITIDKCGGSVNAHTSGGGIKVNEVFGLINASTSGGSVYASIINQPKEDCSLTTSGGGITLILAENINAYLDAKTSGGSVSSEFPITFTGKAKRSVLKGNLNKGGPKLYLRSSGGSIKIQQN